MDNSSLSQIPIELIQRIYVALDAGSALALSQTCRRIRNAFSDWTVLRDLLRGKHGPEYPSSLLLAYNPSRDVWKRYFMAEVRASQRRPITSKDIEQWLPHILALNHPIAMSIDPVIFDREGSNICDEPLETTVPINYVSIQFVICPSSSIELATWRFVQATSFCLSLHLLSSSPAMHTSDEEPPALLQYLQWFRITGFEGEILQNQEIGKHMVMLHTLANRAVGFFVRELRWALANGRTLNPNPIGLFPPPNASTIPLTDFLVPPVPFTPESLEGFGRCHLSIMTEPGFFVDDEWTGYIYNHRTDGGASFVGFGGLPSRRRPSEDQSGINRSIQFHREVQEEDDSKFTIRSHNVRSQAWPARFEITVDRTTGHLIVAIIISNVLRRVFSDAVITPFGIVGGIFTRGSWLWLWKCKWSEQDVVT